MEPNTQQVQGRPGQGFGIASFVSSLFGAGIISLVLGIVGFVRSRRAHVTNGFAIAGIVISSISIVVGLVVIAYFIVQRPAISGFNGGDTYSEQEDTLVNTIGNVKYSLVDKACNGLTCNDLSVTLYLKDTTDARVADTIDATYKYLWNSSVKLPDSITLFIASADVYSPTQSVPSACVDISNALQLLDIKPTITAKFFGSVVLNDDELTLRYG